MQKLTYVLFQIDEARRYMQGGRLEQLRLALLLLDNAAEVQLDRRTRQELAHEDLNERIRRKALQIPAAERPAILHDLTDWQPLTNAAKRRLDRVFDEKLTFLSERYQILDPRLARILAYVHRYRNEAYHRAKVRPETIRTAASILLEANCQLLRTVFRVSLYASNEDYSWVQERFGLGRAWSVDGKALDDIVEALRSGLMPTVETTVETLTGHLTSRVDEIWDALDFTVDNTGIEDRAHALQIAQLHAAAERGEADPSMDPWRYQAAWSVEVIAALGSQIRALESASDRLEAFARFSEIEELIEPIEKEVMQLSGYVDGMIQYQVDLARGK